MAADIDEPTVLLSTTMSYIGGYLPFVCVYCLCFHHNLYNLQTGSIILLLYKTLCSYSSIYITELKYYFKMFVFFLNCITSDLSIIV